MPIDPTPLIHEASRDLLSVGVLFLSLEIGENLNCNDQHVLPISFCPLYYNYYLKLFEIF